MPSKRKKIVRARVESRAADREGRALHALDIVTGSQNLATLSPQEIFDRERPGDVQAANKLARNWHKDNWFVEMMVLLMLAFYNYGLRISARSKSDKEKLKKALENPETRDELLRYIDTSWEEWLVQDSLVSFWREKKAMSPFVLPAETVEYSNAMGIEKLTVCLGIKKEQLMERSQTAGHRPAGDLTVEEVNRYASAKITLSEDHDEHFRVLTRRAKGQGLAIPRLYRVFRTLSQSESMEVGESAYAFAGRLVVRMHKLGFEVRSGSTAAKQHDFMWKKDRSDAIQKFYRGRAGFVETTANFDHNIEHVWTDPKYYDGSKWDTIINRLLWWGGPLGYMMLAKSVSPYLLGMLKALAVKDRQRMGAHLEAVIDRGFNLGVAVQLSWSNRCFHDERLAWDMVKTLMQQGPLSLTSALEEADFDPPTEEERKVKEAAPAQDKALLPKFDPNHGKRPGENPGRKSGVPDNSKVD